jgi:hypothetical protein
MKKSLAMMTAFALMATAAARTQALHAALSTSELASQAGPPSPVLDQIQVRSIHDSGWTSQPVGLALTPEKLLIRASQEYRDNNGYIRYFTFPAEIPLEQIVDIEGKRGTASLLGIQRLTKLHLEFKDEKGKQRTYDFLSQNAIQNYGEWSEGAGRGDDLRQFAQSVRNAISARAEDLKRSPSTLTHPEPKKAQFAVVTIGKSGLSPATVSISPESAPNSLRIAWQGSDNKDDVSLDEILTIETTQRRLSLKSDDPNVIFEINIGIPYGPKLYVLELAIKQGTGKPFIYRIASDEAVCNGADPCQDGQDAGEHLLELAQAIKDAIAVHAEAVKQAAAKEEAFRAQPAALTTTVSFDDSQSFLPDHRLDAGKKAELVIEVANQGPGPAIDVTVNTSSSQAAIKLVPAQSLGEIPPGEKRSVRVPIEVGLNINGSEASVTVDVREKRGFDARTVILVIPVVALERPALTVVSTEVNDGNTGLADGNGNGIPENGEIFELQVNVRNDGKGPAEGTVLSAIHWPKGIEVVRATSDLGVIQSGRSVLGTLAFSIPRAWATSSLDFGIKVSDARGEQVASVSRELTLPSKSLSPALSASLRLLSNGHELADLTNGQSAELEITPANGGNLEATDVSLRVSSPDISLLSNEVSLGTITPGAAQPPQRFGFIVPRNFAASRISLSIELSQSDFPVKVISREMTVRREAPVLKADLTVLDSVPPQTLEQNQTAAVDLRVSNVGGLTAEGVTATIGFGVSTVQPVGPVDAQVGTIQAGESSDAHFRLRVLRSAPLGQLPVQIAIAQTGFPTLNKTFLLTVQAETPLVEKVQPSIETPSSPHRANPPEIIIASPRNGEEVSGKSAQLTGSLDDEHGIADVKVTVNDAPVPDAIVLRGLHRHTSQTKETVDFSLPVLLGPKRNIIRVVAYNNDGERAQAEVSVTQLGESGAPKTKP